jgi:proteasome assembly chaperone (PAC2) family protein
MVGVRFVWVSDAEKLPAHRFFLEAVPGVGNVGKLLLDSLIEKHPSRLLLRILHPDNPPHSTLDEDGLLEPPSMVVHAIDLPNGETIISASSNFQPLTPHGQYELACALLDMARDSGTELMVILAGLATEPGRDAVHLICASAEVRERMQADGIEVSRKHPAAGVIGLTGLLASLAPLHGVDAVCSIAETVGTSVDAAAADRLAAWLDKSFNMGLSLSLDSTEETAAKLLEFMESDEMAEFDDGTMDPDSAIDPSFYA